MIVLVSSGSLNTPKSTPDAAQANSSVYSVHRCRPGELLRILRLQMPPRRTPASTDATQALQRFVRHNSPAGRAEVGIFTTPTLEQVLIMDPAQSAVPQMPAPPSGVQRVAGGAAHGRDDADVVRCPYPEVRGAGARLAAGPQPQGLPRPPRGIEQHRTRPRQQPLLRGECVVQR